MRDGWLPWAGYRQGLARSGAPAAVPWLLLSLPGSKDRTAPKLGRSSMIPRRTDIENPQPADTFQMEALRSRQTYNYRIQEAICATGDRDTQRRRLLLPERNIPKGVTRLLKCKDDCTAIYASQSDGLRPSSWSRQARPGSHANLHAGRLPLRLSISSS